MLTAVGLALFLAAPPLVRPSPASEPDPPRAQTAPLECVAPDEVAPEQHLVLRCAARSGLPVMTVLIYYRQSGTEDFTPAPTLRTRKGWYTATLCPHMLVPGPVHYYVEARNAAGELVAGSGDDESPAVIRVLGPSGPARPPAARDPDQIFSDADPLAPLRARREAARLAEIRRGPRTVFAGLSAGVGYGFYPDRVLDFRKDIEVASGAGAAGPFVLSPEVGYQLTDRVALSIEGRFELIGSSGADDIHPGKPASNAWAVLARASYAWGQGRAQLLASGAVGAGDGIRVVVPATQGAEIALGRADSVRGGPLLLGPGAGFLYHFGPHLAYRAEVTALAGLPSFAAVVDFSTGMQFGF
jgi:hypothetical protein